MLAVALGVARGGLRLVEGEAGPELQATRGDAQSEELLWQAQNHRKGRRLVEWLWDAQQAMRAKAREDAQGELSRQLDEIRAADRAILAMAEALPHDLRRRIAEARASLAPHLARLAAFARRDGRSDQGRRL